MYNLLHGKNEFYAILYKFSPYFPRQTLHKSLLDGKSKKNIDRVACFSAITMRKYFQIISLEYNFKIWLVKLNLF